MAQGFKTGGRAAGTPNKKTSLVERLLEDLKCDPIGIMAEIATNPRTPTKFRFLAARELAGYVYPKRKAIEVTAQPNGKPISVEPHRSEPLNRQRQQQLGSRNSGARDAE